MKIITILVSIILGYLVSTLIHELGHVVCGLLHHWKLFVLVVGPVKFYRESKDLNYYGYYYSYRNAIREGNQEEVNLKLENMERIKSKISMVIVEDCKV